MSQVTSQNALVKDSTVQTLNGKLDNLNATLGGNANIAPVFNTATAYSKGDMVNYNGDLYVFTANHSAGAWTGSDAVQTKVSSELSSLKSGLTKVTLLSPTLATSTETTYEMTDSISKYMMIVACIGFDQYRFQGSITMPIVNTMQYYDVANGDGSKTIGFAFVDATHVKMSGDWYLSIYGIMPIYG